MAKLNIITLGSSKNYTDLAALGLTNVVVNDQDKTISFTLVADGSTRTLHFDQPSDGKDGQDGISITGVNDLGNGKFTLLLSDGSETDPIQTVKGQKGDKGDKLTFNDLTDTEKASLKGDAGISPTITENADNTDKIYKLDIETVDGKFTTPNLKGADGQGGTGSGEENVIESIKVNGVAQTVADDKSVDITVPTVDVNKNYVDTELAKKANVSDIPSLDGYVTETELNAKGYLTEHQDISGKVDKVDGKSLIANTEIERLASVDNYDDSQVKTQIQAVANGLMDSVGYSADYKTIDIIAKNGVKKSVNVAPIISHASITELSDVDTTNKATGKALVYNATTSKHEYADVSGTDEKVKMDASTDAKYLGELLDNITIANENGKLKVKKLDGQEVTITEINYLKGLTMNVMDLVNMFSNGGVKIINTPVATYAELLAIDKSSFIEGISYLVYVLADENHDNAKTTYLVDKDSETPTYFGFADSQRDFTTNPIDLATEITGKLGIANMDSEAIKALFTVDDTYKTETAMNNAFSTHGAKALYDELLLAIGNKANASDLTDHKDDTDIHVSIEDRTKWDSAKTHADSAHAPSNAQENILETVKVNNQEITPDENKAVNINLTGYAEHDEIVGENLIPFPYAQPERTTNGITFTFADDGSVIANGTATENADFSVCVRTNFGTDAALMLKPGIYAITGCPEGGSDSTYRIQVQFGDKTELKYSLKADYGKGFVFEVTEEYAQYACQIQCHVQKGYTVTDLVFKPMLVLGSVLKEYQPYNLSREALRTDIADVTELASRVDNQFATASGNFITVNDSVDGNIVELSVKGNSFQKTYSGKNLLNNTLGTATQNGITCTNNGDGTYTLNGTATSEAVFGFIAGEERKTLYKSVVGKTLKFLDGGFGTSNIGRFLLNIKGDDGNWWPKGEQFNGSVFTVLDGYSEIYVDLRIKKGSTLQNVLLKPMLTTDLDATNDDFEPYVGGIPSPNPSYPQEIKSVVNPVVKVCGKNLLNSTLETTTVNGVTCTNNGDGTYTFNGTATDIAIFVVTAVTEITEKHLHEHLRLTGCPETGSMDTYRLKFWSNVQEPVYDFGGGSKVYIEKTASDGGIEIIIATGFKANNLVFKPMLTTDLNATYDDFEPYQETIATLPYTLNAIPVSSGGNVTIDGQQYIADYVDIEKKQLVRNVFYGILADNIIGSVPGEEDSLYLFELGRAPLPKYSGDSLSKVIRSLCNRHITGTQKDALSKDVLGLNVWDNKLYAYLSKTAYSDITSAKSEFMNEDMTISYQLATPEIIDLTDEEVQAFKDLATYYPTTNVIVSSDQLDGYAELKYPTTDVSGLASRNESRIAKLAKDTDDKFDDINDSLSVIGKCKNLLNPTLQTETHNGVTFTKNDDGTYSLSGSRTDTSSSAYISFIIDYPLEKGRYKLTGALDENNNIRCIIKESGSENKNIYDYGKGAVLDISKPNTTITLMIVSIDDTSQTRIVKPMLTTDLNATYDDFVPYTGDGDTLTHDVAEIKNNLGGLFFSASGTTLTITDGTNTWTLGANS